MPEIMKLYPMLYGKAFYRAALAANAIQRMGKDREVFYNAVIHDKQKQIESVKGKEAKKLIDKSGIPIMNRYGLTFRSFRKGFIKTYRLVAPFEPVIHKIFGVDLPKTLVIVLTENIHGSISCKMLYYNAAETVISLTINHRASAEPGSATGEVMYVLLKSLVLQESFVKQKNPQSELFAEAVLRYFVPYGMLSESMHFIDKRPISDYMRANISTNPKLSDMSMRLLPHMEEYYRHFATMTIWEYLQATEFAEYTHIQ